MPVAACCCWQLDGGGEDGSRRSKILPSTFTSDYMYPLVYITHYSTLRHYNSDTLDHKAITQILLQCVVPSLLTSLLPAKSSPGPRPASDLDLPVLINRPLLPSEQDQMHIMTTLSRHTTSSLPNTLELFSLLCLLLALQQPQLLKIHKACIEDRRVPPCSWALEIEESRDLSRGDVYSEDDFREVSGEGCLRSSR